VSNAPAAADVDTPIPSGEAVHLDLDDLPRTAP
jgi:hypothetical protein